MKWFDSRVSLFVIVEKYSYEGSCILSEFVHLVLEFCIFFSWESFKVFCHRGHFSNEYKHVLWHIFRELLWSAFSCISCAESHQINWALFEFANAQIFQDFSHSCKHIKVFLDVCNIWKSSNWIDHFLLEGNNIFLSFFI